jgi:hypothetical protein
LRLRTVDRGNAHLRWAHHLVHFGERKRKRGDGPRWSGSCEGISRVGAIERWPGGGLLLRLLQGSGSESRLGGMQRCSRRCLSNRVALSDGGCLMLMGWRQLKLRQRQTSCREMYHLRNPLLPKPSSHRWSCRHRCRLRLPMSCPSWSSTPALSSERTLVVILPIRASLSVLSGVKWKDEGIVESEAKLVVARVQGLRCERSLIDDGDDLLMRVRVGSRSREHGERRDWRIAR